MSRVFVLGNAGMDIGLPVSRLPRPGETLVGGALSRAPGGKGLNQAVMAARAGADVHFLAPLGRDPDGDAIEAALRQEGFASLELPRLPQATDLSLLLVLPDGENSIVTAGACADALDPGTAERFAGQVAVGDVLLLQGNLSQAATGAALRAAQSRGACTMLNTAPLRWDAVTLLPYCSVLVANAGEAQQVIGQSGLSAAAALNAAGVAIAIVTLGAEGCALADGAGRRYFPAPSAHALDTTGAGDAFCGVLAAQLARGISAQAALGPAQRAAALAVGRSGAYAALPDRAEMRGLLGDGTALPPRPG